MIDHKISTLAAKAHTKAAAPVKKRRFMPKPPGGKAMYSMSEFCEAHGICKSTAYNEVTAGRLKLTRIGRRVLIAKPDAEAWVDAVRDGGADTGARDALK